MRPVCCGTSSCPSRIIMSPGRTSRWPRTRRQRNPCSRRISEALWRSRKLAVFTTATSGAPPELSGLRGNWLPRTAPRIPAARNHITLRCGNFSVNFLVLLQYSNEAWPGIEFAGAVCRRPWAADGICGRHSGSMIRSRPTREDPASA
jgi:hypothetical protein